MFRRWPLVTLVLLLVVSGCSTSHSPTTPASKFQFGESVVLVGLDPAQVALKPSPKHPVSVRSTYLDNLSNTVHYAAGQDYLFDYASGSIRRVPGSRIPDFSTNILFGKENFDHSKFPGYGNGPFFAFIDYAARKAPTWPVQASQTNLLRRTLIKLHKNETLTVLAFGDSITAGGEATRPELIYWQRWAHSLKQKYPQATIETVNAATGGDTTANGLDRLEEKVLKRRPDLVLIAFGMNDHNIGGFGVPLEGFTQNLRTMIDRVRDRTPADIILVSTFPPNPKWHYGSHRMEQYALATEQVAREKFCAYADVYHQWQTVAAAKKPEDLLGNNINHPNDFGHAIYFQALQQIGL